MDIYEKTDIGCKRSENQDRVVTMRLDDSTVFAVVCDGMGGENAGSLASEKAIEVVCDRVKSAYRSGCDANSVKSLLILLPMTKAKGEWERPAWLRSAGETWLTS